MSDFRIKTCPVGQIGTNCYVVYKEGMKHAVIVDPGANGAFLLNKCRELGVEPEAILLTHGHFDHIMAVDEIRRSFPDIDVYIGEKEEDLVMDPMENLSARFGRGFSVKAGSFVAEGDELDLAGITWKVLETPGHTKGSVCYFIEEEEVLISGDTLFAESLGRTDFPTGSSAQIVESIREKLFTLPEDVMVYPGHGEATTIGHEKKYNPVAVYRG